MGKCTPGIFVISLDFEMYWGVRDVFTLVNYESNLKGEYQAIQKILDLFMEFNIHATWATVGFLFYKNQHELMNEIPKTLPEYTNKNFSPYIYLFENLTQITTNYHFAPQLIRQIQQVSGQEIGTHTFSHYYCLETGQTKESFAADIDAAIRIGRTFEVQLQSIVFPRNQYNQEYLSILAENNIKAYRGNENHWLYSAVHSQGSYKLKRVLRLLDAYINLSGFHCYSLNALHQGSLINIPSSRFLRPYQPRLRFLEKLRLQRIKNSISHAAKHGKLYHLWWHPHNFGKYTQKNITFLREILLHFKIMQDKYQMQTMNMSEVTSIYM